MRESIANIPPESLKQFQELIRKSEATGVKGQKPKKGKSQGTLQNPDTPRWFQEGKILEIEFCEDFLKRHPVRSYHGKLYDVDGAVDEEKLKKEILLIVKGFVGVNVSSKLDHIVSTLKIVSYSGEIKPQLDRIHVANGTLFLDGRFTDQKEFCLNRLPIRYRPDAPKPEMWLRFLGDLFYEEDVKALQEFLGYTFLPTNKGQAMLIIIGRGGEGKSQIGIVLHEILGNSMNFGSIQKLAGNRFYPASQEGMLLLLDDDMGTDALTDTGVIKSIITATGGFDLERKGKQSVQGRLYVRLIALSNAALSSLYDKSEAFYRRQLVILVKDKPKDRKDDPNIAEEMCREKEGIFLWCFEGLQRLIGQDYQFSVSPRMKANLEQIRRDADTVLDFYESEGYIRFEENTHATSVQLYRAYRRFCDDNAMAPVSQTTFTRRMKTDAERLHIRHIKIHDRLGDNGRNGYEGVHVLINTDMDWKQGMVPVHQSAYF